LTSSSTKLEKLLLAYYGYVKVWIPVILITNASHITDNHNRKLSPSAGCALAGIFALYGKVILRMSQMILAGLVTAAIFTLLSENPISLLTILDMFYAVQLSRYFVYIHLFLKQW
jgi:hypothetical protein